MTLVDNETGENIINPYIRISFNGKDFLGWAAINTSTFGDCQDELIYPIDHKTLSNLDKNIKLYNIIATVGEYNSFPDSNYGLKTVSLIRPARAEILLGYLKEETIREYFPNSFKYFEGLRSKGKNPEKISLETS